MQTALRGVTGQGQRQGQLLKALDDLFLGGVPKRRHNCHFMTEGSAEQSCQISKELWCRVWKRIAGQGTDSDGVHAIGLAPDGGSSKEQHVPPWEKDLLVRFISRWDANASDTPVAAVQSSDGERQDDRAY